MRICKHSHKQAAVILAGWLLAAPAFAQEQAGCDKFKWPLERERALLAHAPPAKSGGEVSSPPAAVKLTLVPASEVKLPMAPTRMPKEGSYAGVLNAAALPTPGTYRVTLSANAWIEVVQDGKLVNASEFSGVDGCDGLRKSVKFILAAKPFIIELTGVTTPDIHVAVTPD